MKNVMAKKAKVAELVKSMTSAEREDIAQGFIDMQSNASDDGSGWKWGDAKSMSNMLKVWATSGAAE